jgi:hypothetical protein
VGRDRNEVLPWIGGPVAAVVLGVCLIPLRELTVSANLSFAFVALTIVVAQLAGRAVGVTTAVASALSLDFFLTRPYFQLAIEDKHDVIAFLGLGACGIIASAMGHHRAEPRPDVEPEDSRFAELHLQYLRSLAWSHLRWALVVSVAVWIQSLWPVLPGPLAWLAVLAQAFFLAMATGCAAVQEQWLRRGLAGREPGEAVIRKRWDDAEELRSALWFALGLISIVPWTYVAFGRRAPTDVLYGAIACSAAVLLLLALLTAFIRSRRPLDAPGSGSPRA